MNNIPQAGLNSLYNNRSFRSTALFKVFEKKPYGFIDIGSAGGVHPLIMPVVSLTHCVCFEPDTSAYRELAGKYEADSPFSKTTIFNTAISGRSSMRTLHVTRRHVNTSLLEPSPEMWTRYNAHGFKLEKKIRVKTEPLDKVIYSKLDKSAIPGEFIKIDCQGIEYEILKGSQRLLKNNCVAAYIELEFFPLYKKQKLFSEVDLYMRKLGFQLYGLYPHYVSSKAITRKKYDYQERITWADALYFKDPFAGRNPAKGLSKRNIDALLLTTIITRFYDLALEIAKRCYKGGAENGQLVKLILSLAARDKKIFAEEARALAGKIRKNPKYSYLLAKKFIDSHKNNSDLDFIKLPQ